MQIKNFRFYLVSSVFIYLFIQNIIASSPQTSRIKQILVKMTLEEKIGQMAQFQIDSQRDMNELKKAIRKGQVGSFLNAGDRKTKLELQRVTVEESRLGIPLLFGRDVIHGYRTIFPIPLGQTASWNPNLVQKAAAVAAREAASQDIHWTFAPMLDISRDARWGRITESCGEDPYLAATMAKRYCTHGIQEPWGVRH